MGGHEQDRADARSSMLYQHRTKRGCDIAIVRYRRGLHLAPHAHGFSSISMLLRGRLRENVGPTVVRPRAFDLVIKPRGTRHENVFLDRETTMIQVAPTTELLDRAIDAHSPLADWGWTNGRAAARAFLRLARKLASAANDVELQPTVDDVLASISLDGSDRPTGPAPPWLRRVRDAFDDATVRRVEPPTVSALAADAGVHRVHLSREFRRHFGVPPTEYRVQARLSEAANHLARSRDSLSATAYRIGFSDQAHMTREFSDRLGMTPLEYRQLLHPFAA